MSRAATVSTFAGIGKGSDRIDADPITTEVIAHGLESAADQMRLALRRTAFSPVIYEMTDFAAALYDPNLRLLAQGQSLPMFLGTLSFCVEAAVRRSGGVEALEPDDLIVTTDGYDTGAHPQDLTIVMPAFFDEELVGYAVIKAHHLDLGAKEIYCTNTVDVFQEGAVFPSVKLYRGGVRQEDLYRTLLANSRLPHALAGDLSAQIGAAKIGLNGLHRVIRRYGVERFRDGVELMLDHGESVMRSLCARIPDGRYVASGEMDDNGVSAESIPFDIAVEVAGSDIVIDFTSAPDEQGGPVNCPLPTTVSAARLAIMVLAGGRKSANEGYFRPIEVRTRPETMFHPVRPAPVFLYFWSGMQAVDVIHKALADAIPDVIPAGSGGDHGCILWWGTRRDGALWSDAMDHNVGMGASSHSDAGSPLMHIAASGVRATSVEVWEGRHPFVVERYECAQDSGGAGQFRGGLGINIDYRALEDVYITSTFERTKTPPWGLHGGQSARPMRFRIRYLDGTTKEIGKATAVHVPAGTVLEVQTGGGGGYGPAAHRDVERIQEDIRDEYISLEAAERDYPYAITTLAVRSTR